jgi:hypothetical protein
MLFEKTQEFLRSRLERLFECEKSSVSARKEKKKKKEEKIPRINRRDNNKQTENREGMTRSTKDFHRFRNKPCSTCNPENFPLQFSTGRSDKLHTHPLQPVEEDALISCCLSR